ncbi:MAG TPA: type II secretion system minor pseudopilin GspK [Xanthomonadaceae bacterium]|nr:type II secretion system minor pseudopilin GspK [Xanthomonadaceae bacterium]
MQRGAALLLVLWLVAMLAALVGAFAMIAQVEHMQGQVLFRGVVARQAARAGLDYAMTRLGASDPSLAWIPDGRTHAWAYHGALVEVVAVDEQGKVDLNLAGHPLLSRLLEATGSAPEDAGHIAAAILDWRDPDPLTQPAGGAEDPRYAAEGLPYGAKDAPFEDVSELQQVLGVDRALFERVAPYLTVHGGRPHPDAAFAPGPVLTAIGLDAPQVIALRRAWDPASGQPPPMLPGVGPIVAFGSGTYSIDSRARLRDGRETVLRVVVRAGGSGLPGSTYTPLEWEEEASR